MTRSSFLVVAVGTAVLTSCSALQPPADLDREARAFMGLVVSNQLDSAFAHSRFDGPPDTLRRLLAAGRDFITSYAVDSAQLVGWNVNSMGGTRRGALTYEVGGESRWALLLVTIEDDGTIPRITGFRWEPSSARLADLHAFSLGGRSLAHYLYLLLALAAAATCLIGAVMAAVRRLGVRWILFSLIGVGTSTINWTTGEQAFNPFSVRLFAASYVRRGPVAPWHISWSLPLGAILVLIRWKTRRTADSPEPPVAA
jgi:hypothetical protein